MSSGLGFLQRQRLRISLDMWTPSARTTGLKSGSAMQATKNKMPVIAFKAFLKRTADNARITTVCRGNCLADKTPSLIPLPLPDERFGMQQT